MFVFLKLSFDLLLTFAIQASFVLKNCSQALLVLVFYVRISKKSVCEIACHISFTSKLF